MKGNLLTPTNLEKIAEILDANNSKRAIVAIAGPPGVGKTTSAKTLAKILNAKHPISCAVLAMDGFHFDDTYLKKMQWRARKGAPHTFDVGGLENMLLRLRKNQESEIAIPIFDRSIEIARAGAQMIRQQTKIVLVEGNYLLLNEPPWQSLKSLFDVTIMLTCPISIIHERLRQRWVDYNYSEVQISRKMNENDIPNVNAVINRSVDAKFQISTQPRV